MFANDIHGACYGFKTELVEKLGFLDEEAFPQGYGEENDLYIRLNEIGKFTILSLSTYFIHYGNQSFGEAKKQLNKSLGKKSLAGKHSGKVDLFYKNVYKSSKVISSLIAS